MLLIYYNYGKHKMPQTNTANHISHIVEADAKDQKSFPLRRTEDN